jgi:hypothetical protein
MVSSLAIGVLWHVAHAIVAVAGGPHHGAAQAPASGTVVFGGDVIPHGDLLRSVEAHGPDSLLEPLAPVLRAADVALVNLETPVAASTAVVRAGFRFNVHPEFVQTLTTAGVDGASIANNHSYDMGSGAVGETIRALHAAGLRPIGGALASQDAFVPQEFPLAGGTMCVFAATRLVNVGPPPAGRPHVALARSWPEVESRRLLEAVRRHRARCGAVVVSLHAGMEYRDGPLAGDRAFFRLLAEAGADAIVAHHPHTPQPVEVHVDAAGRRVPIFCSVGNLVSNQGNRADLDLDPRPGGRWELGLDGRTREGLLAVLRFESAGDGRLRLADFGYVPLWTVNTHLAASVHNGAPHIAAALMPRAGGSDAMLQRRWERLVARIGPGFLLPVASVPGGAEGYARSERAVMDNRRAVAPRVTSSVSARGSRVAQTPARRPR